MVIDMLAKTNQPRRDHRALARPERRDHSTSARMADHYPRRAHVLLHLFKRHERHGLPARHISTVPGLEDTFFIKRQRIHRLKQAVERLLVRADSYENQYTLP